MFVPAQDSAKVSLPGADASVVAELKAAAKEEVFSGKAKETLSVRNFNSADAKHLLLVGLGKIKTGDTETIRQAAAVATNELSRLKWELRLSILKHF